MNSISSARAVRISIPQASLLKVPDEHAPNLSATSLYYPAASAVIPY